MAGHSPALNRPCGSWGCAGVQMGETGNQVETAFWSQTEAVPFSLWPELIRATLGCMGARPVGTAGTDSSLISLISGPRPQAPLPCPMWGACSIGDMLLGQALQLVSGPDPPSGGAEQQSARYPFVSSNHSKLCSQAVLENCGEVPHTKPLEHREGGWVCPNARGTEMSQSQLSTDLPL